MFKIVRNVVSGEHLTVERFAIKVFVPGTVTIEEHWEFITNSYNDLPIEFYNERVAIAFVRSNFGSTVHSNNYWDDVIEISLK